MKKKLLFVIESLMLGGAEKSLVTLLNLLDYTKYDVDVLLFAQGGAFQKLLPEEVNLLSVPSYFEYSSIPWKNVKKKIVQPRKMVAQLRYSVSLRIKKHNHIEKAVLLWQASRKCFAILPKEYDFAIAYAQGVPTFFVAEKVKAKKKAAWINVTYIPEGRYLNYIKSMYTKYDFVNAVSESVLEQMQSTFNITDEKAVMIKDILDVQFAKKMSEMKNNAIQEMDGAGLKLLTVGRLSKMKGHDLAIDAAKILKDKGIKFTWYAVGDGPLRSELEEQIANNGLQSDYIILGSRHNPYPYFKICDLYVQTSRFEGFGITLAEAKMFHKPIVTTNFDAAGAQFENEKNGLVVDISAQAIADGIIRMISDDKMRGNCVTNIINEKVGNVEEIEKFYRMVENEC